MLRTLLFGLVSRLHDNYILSIWLVRNHATPFLCSKGAGFSCFLEEEEFTKVFVSGNRNILGYLHWRIHIGLNNLWLCLS